MLQAPTQMLSRSWAPQPLQGQGASSTRCLGRLLGNNLPFPGFFRDCFCWRQALRSSLKPRTSYTLTETLGCSPTPPADQPTSSLAHRPGSQVHSLVTFLHGKPHLRACFLGNHPATAANRPSLDGSLFREPFFIQRVPQGGKGVFVQWMVVLPDESVLFFWLLLAKRNQDSPVWGAWSPFDDALGYHIQQSMGHHSFSEHHFLLGSLC